MKNALKASTILSWFNLIVWGLFTGVGLLMAIFGNLIFLIIPFLTSVVILHSYAALQLHKSIKNPTVPLSSQTPVGIRFIGFITLFFGIFLFTQGLGVLQNIGEIVKLMEPQMPPQFKGVDLHNIYIKAGVFILLVGISTAANVFLNFRLLRWYLFLRENDIS